METRKTQENIPQIPKINYPQHDFFWRDVQPDERIKIINSTDYNPEALWETLFSSVFLTRSFLSSLGTTNEQEIQERLEISNFLLNHPEMITFFLDLKIFSTNFQKKSFIRHFTLNENNHNIFWQTIFDLINQLKKHSDLPKRFQELVSFLENSLFFEETENNFATEIKTEIEKTSQMQGYQYYEVDIQDYYNLNVRVTPVSRDDWYVFGNQVFSKNVLTLEPTPYPQWTQKAWHPGVWLGLAALAKVRIDKKNQQEKGKAFQSSFINKLPSLCTNDIAEAITKIFAKAINPENEEGRENYTKASFSFYLQVSFQYNKDGLEIALVNILSNLNGKKTTYCTLPFYNNYFPIDEDNFTEAQLHRLEKEQELVVDNLQQTTERFKVAQIMQQLNTLSNSFEFWQRSFQVKEVPYFNKYFRWFALDNLFELKQYQDTYQAIIKNIEFVNKQIDTLQNIARAILALQQLSTKHNASLCIANLKPEKNIIAFDALYPLHLFNEKDITVVPITNLPPLNGQIVGLTGAHGGGKTTTKLALVDNIFLIQSGLPNFGKNCTLNVKQAIGPVFLERQRGQSTVEVLVTKITNLFEELEKTDAKKIVILLDELGTGTQEYAGQEFGVQVLKNLTKFNTTIVFSTQIQSLAKYTVDQLGAKCYFFDAGHNMKEGIKDGGMQALVQRSGLAYHLK